MEFAKGYYFSATKLYSNCTGTHGELTIITEPGTEIYVDDKTLIVIPGGGKRRGKIDFETSEDANACKKALQDILNELYK